MSCTAAEDKSWKGIGTPLGNTVWIPPINPYWTGYDTLASKRTRLYHLVAWLLLHYRGMHLLVPKQEPHIAGHLIGSLDHRQ